MSGLGVGTVPGGPAAPSCRPKSLSSASPLPPGRLASFRTRDLTLGGAMKKNKKTFEPNVHAVRKTREELKAEPHVATKKVRKARSEKRRESGGRRKEHRQTIQSHSIFEQRPADTGPRTVSAGAPAVVYTPLHPVCTSLKKESEDEEQILHRLQRDDFMDDPTLRNEEKLKPIQLPLTQSRCLTHSPSRTGFKESPGSKGAAGARAPGAEQPSLAELLRQLRLSEGEELFFMQLPDCLPGMASGPKTPPTMPPTAQSAARKRDKSKDKSINAHTQPPEDGSVLLSNLSEGFLGKLQIRKSGRVELKMGGVNLDVSKGAAFSFLQELVCVHASAGHTGTGDMMVLGNIKHKLVLSPDFQTLLTQATTPPPESSR